MQSTASPRPLSVSPTSLAAACTDLPDPRRAASVRYPLPAILALTVAALLANQLSVLAIAEWAGRQDADLLAALGLPAGATPCQSTLQRLFRQLDGQALATCLTTYFAPSVTPTRPDPATEAPALQGIAIDGKAQRGRLRFPGGGCPVHALSAFCHDHGVVLAHEPIAAATATERGEAELTVAPGLVARLDWTGRVLTGDALFCQRALCQRALCQRALCQRALCQQVREAGGHYLVLVKENQGTLYRDIELLFDPPAAVAALPLLDRRTTRTVETGHGRRGMAGGAWPAGHGRRGEVREVVASTDLVGELDWPDHAQVFRVERTWCEQGQRKQARHYGITSLAPVAADPARLLALKRGHWTIENRLHRRKDVTFGEDASLIHVGHGPTVLALLRDTAVSVLHRAGIQRVAAQLRRHSQFPAEAVAFVIGPAPTHA